MPDPLRRTRVGPRAAGVQAPWLLCARAGGVCLLIGVLRRSSGSSSPTATATFPDARRAPSPSARGRLRRPTALAALAALTVKGRAPRRATTAPSTGRPGWTRTATAATPATTSSRRDLTRPSSAARTNGCLVESGDPRTTPTPATDIALRPRRRVTSSTSTTSSRWRTPGHRSRRWDIRKRAALANDPMNLLAVDASREPAEGRRRRRDLAPAEQALPLRLRRTAGRR